MAHTKGHIFGKKVVKELKTWTKPVKGITFTPFKAAVSLGKTLPRMALGAAKLAFKHPITTTATWLIGKKILKTKPGLKFPKHRQFDKRGRKFI